MSSIVHQNTLLLPKYVRVRDTVIFFRYNLRLMDKLTPEQRHVNMSRIKSRDTKPELAVRSALHGIGFRFRKNDRRLSGTPDIVFPRYHAVIFVNGCFWHGHGGCPKFRIPKTNTGFWTEKIGRNRRRDAADIAALNSEGWRVGIVWECSVTGKNRASKLRDVAGEISLWLEDEFGDWLREF